MDLHQDIVLLFTRFPQPGTSKTRLIPVLGDLGAAELQKSLTEHTVYEITRLKSLHPCCLEIHYTGGDRASMQAWLGKGHLYKRQSEGHIGDRMAQAIAGHLGQKRGIILVGSDLPHISANILGEALLAVQRCDLVIGPACDGGYYLIGVNRSMKPDVLAALFSDIPWGSAEVFTKTVLKARHYQLTSHILPKLHDIDRPEDLRYLDNYPDAQ